MKRIVFILLLAGIPVAAQEQVNWMTMNEALEAQKTAPKKIFMDVYTTWCGPCKMMDRNTFSNPDVIDYLNEHFYSVKFNAEGTEEVDYQGFNYTNPNYREGRRGRNATHFFADALKVQGYPTVVFFEENGDLIQSVVGYKTPRQLEIFLKLVASDDFKDVTTSQEWQRYQRGFKHEFRE